MAANPVTVEDRVTPEVQATIALARNRGLLRAGAGGARAELRRHFRRLAATPGRWPADESRREPFWRNAEKRTGVKLYQDTAVIASRGQAGNLLNFIAAGGIIRPARRRYLVFAAPDGTLRRVREARLPARPEVLPDSARVEKAVEDGMDKAYNRALARARRRAVYDRHMEGGD